MAEGGTGKAIRYSGDRDPNTRASNLLVSGFHDHGGGLAAADADRGHSALLLFPPQRADQSGENPRSRSPDRTTQRAGAPPHVDLRRVEGEIVDRGHRDGGECLVDLEEVDVVLP